MLNVPDIVPLARGDIDAGVMFPDFILPHKKLWGGYREFKSDAYVAQFVLSASTDVDERAAHVQSFKALIKAEKFIKQIPQSLK